MNYMNIFGENYFAIECNAMHAIAHLFTIHHVFDSEIPETIDNNRSQ